MQALLPCLACSVLRRVTLSQILSVGPACRGISCTQLGLVCQTDSESSLQGVRDFATRGLDPRPDPLLPHTMVSDAERPAEAIPRPRGEYDNIRRRPSCSAGASSWDRINPTLPYRVSSNVTAPDITPGRRFMGSAPLASREESLERFPLLPSRGRSGQIDRRALSRSSRVPIPPLFLPGDSLIGPSPLGFRSLSYGDSVAYLGDPQVDSSTSAYWEAP